MIWLLPGKGKAVSLLPHTSPEFSYLAYFVLSSEEDHPAAVRSWRRMLELMDRGAGSEQQMSVEEAAKKVAEEMETNKIDLVNLPIYRYA